MARFTEITSSTSKSYLRNGSWTSYSQSCSSSQLDGLKFQTGGQPFYLKYRTCNKGYGWYPYVTSQINDYAGSSGKAIEAVQIQVYDNAGTKLDKNYIVMYRAYAEYRWLAWVSNASPDRMQMIKDQFNLDGPLDLKSSNSGLPGDGIPITQFEIRIFSEDSSSGSTTTPPIGANGITQSYMVNGSWNGLTSTTSSQMHGVRIQTSGKPYFLKYRTYNSGYGWYPYVNSNDTSDSAYAGSSGKNIEGIQIQVYDNNGKKLNNKFVVMYRVFTDGKWLSWVSNAPLDLMQSIYGANNLDGNLDGDSSNAGYPGTGKPITQLDIRVYEYVQDANADSSGNSYPTTSGDFSQSYRSSGTWNILTPNTFVTQMDGVKLTTNNSNYYFAYRTCNTGSGWLPYVRSTSIDYAGSVGKPVEAIGIQVYDGNGIKLDDKHVVMYRAYANGAWLPWVSNANPTKMQEIKDREKFDGDLDVTSGHAGSIGIPLNKLEIRFYPNETTVPPTESKVEKLTLSYMVNSSAAWTTFGDSVIVSKIDGIKIQTSTSKPYYLQYRTFNTGKTDWYPYVKSTINDYAGSAGKPIQKLQIQAYKNDGTKLSSGIVVMYRAYVDNEWKPWVSNANQSSMEYVHKKYNLGGTLDVAGSYAGVTGKAIGGVEIRVFEESLPDSTTTTTSITTQETGGNGMKIYIDPGHGGSDPGACSSTYHEKDYTLRISLLEKELLSNMGFNVKLSRETDIYHSLDDRTNDANLWGADLFISNHINAVGGQGVEVYYSTLKNDQSQKYATAIESSLSTIFKSRGIKTRVDADGDYYHVIREANMTSILIEQGFIDNDIDRLLLNNPNNIQKIAQTVAQAIYDTVDVKPVPLSPSVVPDNPTEIGYKFGAVKNPKTLEVYPIYIPDNSGISFDIPYEEEIDADNEKPTKLSKTNFDWLHFFTGIELEDFEKKPLTDGITKFTNRDKDGQIIDKRPAFVGIGSLVAGVISSAQNSLDTLYLTVNYFKNSSTGKKRAIIECGNSDYYRYFINLIYTPFSLKSLCKYGDDAGNVIQWSRDVNEVAAELYHDITNNQINNNYSYDLVFDFDKRRRDCRYSSRIWIDKNGDMFERPIIFPNDHIYIIVNSKLNIFNQIDKVDIISYLDVSTKVSEEVQNAFNIETLS